MDTLDFIAGVAYTEDISKMMRMIFRISKGRAIFKVFNYFEAENDLLIEKVKDTDLNITSKKIFLIVFQGSVERVLLLKIIKICDLYNASRFTLPQANHYKKEIDIVSNELSNQENLCKKAKSSLLNFLLTRIGQGDEISKYEFYKDFIRLEKYIYSNLNKCEVSENFIICEIFTLEENIQIINENALKIYITDYVDDAPSFTLTKIVDSKSSNKIVHPTYIKTNEFTWVFQELVNTYGIPRYQEINPALFNIITFPFLFGIMFGDIVHGLVLFFIGVYLVFNADSMKKDDESKMKLFLPVRYLFVMMGFFSFFAGLLYNDFASLPLPINNSCFVNTPHNKADDPNAIEYWYGQKKTDCEYFFGIDHKWYSSTNELSFVNSLKMKISVLIGVVHMLGGIILKGMNLSFFNHNIEFFFEFIPQIIFFVVLFVYMDLLIVLKWLTKWNDLGSTKERPPNSPGITSTVLNIVLKMGKIDENVDVSFKF